MRLISQNEIIDIPYEKVCLYVTQSEEGAFDIVARSEGATYIMARYQKREDAIHWMSMVRNASPRVFKYYIFPEDENDSNEGD